MKPYYLIGALCTALFFSSCVQEGWTLVNESTGTSYPATVPSTVAGVLMDNGVLPDNLLEGRNLSHADLSALEGPWTYRQVFRVKDMSKHYTLRFEGIGYRADIFLNGSQIASRDTTFGVFAVRDFDVTGLLKRKNVLEVRLEGAKSGDLNIGFVDWNPVPPGNSEGLVREVKLLKSGPVRLKDVYVHSVLADDFSEASLVVRSTLVNLTGEPQEVTLAGSVEELSFKAQQALAAHEVQEVFDTLKLEHPRLWWSRDLGTPELYTLSLKASVGEALSDESEVTFGVRRIESRLDENGHRAYWLNGKKLLLLGGGWTDEIFLRNTHESLEQEVQLVADANLNCIRFENIWGKDSYVYDLCDRYGILALVGWSCQWEWESYCGIPHHSRYGCILDEEHNELALRYFKDQVRWLRNHPAVIAWFTGSDRVPNPELEQDYLKVFAELDNRPYICSASALGSLAGPSGNKMVGPYEYVGPEYWYDPQNRVGSAYGFNTETSIGLNMPQLESVKQMLGEEAWPLGPAWDYHCTAAGEDMHDTHVIQAVVAGQFGEASTLEGFVARAQAVDYDGTRAMFEAFRVRRPQATGVIQWMQNSAWPSLYWQLYDYYGLPTAGYFGVKKGCAPLQVLYNWEERRFYAVNGTGAPATLNVELSFYSAASKPLDSVSVQVDVPEAGSVPLPVSVPAEDVFVFIGGDADNFYAIPLQGNVHDWAASSWYQTPISTYADLGFVSALPSASLELVREGQELCVKNPTDQIAYQVVLKAPKADGTLDAAVRWSDNFFTLAPGATRTVSFTGNPEVITYSAGLGK